MNLTGKELVDLAIITGVSDPENIQQHGVDLNLVDVKKITGEGFIPKEGKTKLAERHTMQPNAMNGTAWRLEPGVYEVNFMQGCKIPKDQRMQIIHRSSLFRNGNQLISALFDAGFETDQIGTSVVINQTITIEKGARIAQIVATSSNEVFNLYNGQWQNDKQRQEVREDLTAL